MITLKGMTWDHARGYDPMIATSKEYSKRFKCPIRYGNANKSI